MDLLEFAQVYISTSEGSSYGQHKGSLVAGSIASQDDLAKGSQRGCGTSPWQLLAVMKEGNSYSVHWFVFVG